MLQLKKSTFISVAILCMVIGALYWLMRQDKDVPSTNKRQHANMAGGACPFLGEGVFETFEEMKDENDKTNVDLPQKDMIEMLSMDQKNTENISSREEIIQKQAQIRLEREERQRREADDRIGSDDEGDGQIVPNIEDK